MLKTSLFLQKINEFFFSAFLKKNGLFTAISDMLAILERESYFALQRLWVFTW